MNRDTWAWEYGHCCMVFLLAGNEIINQLTCRSQGCKLTNAEYQGILFPDCLEKLFPCSAYLFHDDREIVEHVLEQGSDLLPDDDEAEILTPEQFMELCEDESTVIDCQLQDGETLDDLRAIIERVTAENGLTPDWDNPLEQPRPCVEIPLDRTPPGGLKWWIYLVIGHWAPVLRSRVFEADPDYVLIKLLDGNLMRVRKDIVHSSSELWRESSREPTEKPNVQVSILLQKQIFVYHCLDGYFEWHPHAYTNGESASLFPFNNPAWDPVVRSAVIDAMNQFEEAGQARARPAWERGDEILNRIFSDTSDSEIEEPEAVQPKKIHACEFERKEVRLAKLNPGPVPPRCIDPVSGIFQSGIPYITWHEMHRARIIKHVCFDRYHSSIVAFSTTGMSVKEMDKSGTNSSTQ